MMKAKGFIIGGHAFCLLERGNRYYIYGPAGSWEVFFPQVKELLLSYVETNTDARVVEDIFKSFNGRGTGELLYGSTRRKEHLL